MASHVPGAALQGVEYGSGYWALTSSSSTQFSVTTCATRNPRNLLAATPFPCSSSLPMRLVHRRTAPRTASSYSTASVTQCRDRQALSHRPTAFSRTLLRCDRTSTPRASPAEAATGHSRRRDEMTGPSLDAPLLQ